MKYMVEIEVQEVVGNALERQPGGPGPIVGRILEQFRPECTYMATSERRIFMVCDIEDTTDLAALMIASARFGQTYPKFTPVIAGAEFGDAVQKATETANRLMEG